jgi:hypothetical protein
LLQAIVHIKLRLAIPALETITSKRVEENKTMIRWLQPKEKLEEREVRRGLGMLMADGMCSQVMGVFTGGAFLVAFALLLGASNFVIGLLAAVGPFSQMLQIPAIFLVDRTEHRI